MKLAISPKLVMVTAVVFGFFMIGATAGTNSTGVSSQRSTFGGQAKESMDTTIRQLTPTPFIPTVTPERTLIPSPIQPTPLDAQAFQAFVSDVSDGDREQVTGVYIEDVLALQVLQQPNNDWTWVSPQWGKATQFESATANGVTGILAHNYLSGRYFYRINQGDNIFIVMGDGQYKVYSVSEISYFQKINPNSLTSRMVDVATGKEMSSDQVFKRFYTGKDKVTLQTCVDKNDQSWGLVFIVAYPLN